MKIYPTDPQIPTDTISKITVGLLIKIKLETIKYI